MYYKYNKVKNFIFNKLQSYLNDFEVNSLVNITLFIKKHLILI